MRRGVFSTQLFSVATAVLCSVGVASAQQQLPFDGRWTAGAPYSDPMPNDPMWGQQCVVAGMLQIQVEARPTGAGQYEGTMVQSTHLQILGALPTAGLRDMAAVRQRCGLRNAGNEMIAMQVKGWNWRGRLASDGTMNVATTSAECRNDWCTNVDPRFSRIRPGASNFETRFTVYNGVMYDNAGTPAPDDDLAFIPRAQYDARAQDGATVATQFARALIAGNINGATALIAPGVPFGDSLNQTVQMFSSAPARVQGVSTLVPHLSTRGQRQTDSWVILLSLQLNNGTATTMMVTLVSDPNANPRVINYWIM